MQLYMNGVSIAATAFINSGSDILATQKFKGVHIGTGQTINNYFDTRNVRMTISYKFGSNKIKAARQRTTGIEEEKSRT